VKLVSYDDRGRALVGMLVDDTRIIPLSSGYASLLREAGAEAPRAEAVAESVFGTMVQLIGAGDWGKEQAGRTADHVLSAREEMVADLGSVRLLAPLRPVALRDCIAFETHLKNVYENLGGKPVPPDFYKIPVYYKGNHDTVVGPDTDVEWPSYSNEWDYELEMGVVIGRSGVDIPVEQAESHIYGLTIFNDFSARDVLRPEIAIGLGPAKAKDFATAIGPWLVTMDEIPDLYDLEMVARVNGEVWSTGNVGQIYWKFADIISRMSAHEPIRSGEIFGSGTVAFGCGLELGKYLKDGDTVELEISGLGVLRNRVIAPKS
jgi:2-keto-4-pentenoate hydratase/2-oxohepta-3-ene-1,7-dioic acid hydratase in catechol pathway